MPARFSYPRRVQFHETDLAGIAHFSWYVRYMEEAEHAMWRSLGMSIVPKEGDVRFPRVSVQCDFKAPLAFEDEFEVLIEVETLGRRSIRYACTITRGDQVVATGSMTSACVIKGGDGRLSAVEIPDRISDRLR